MARFQKLLVALAVHAIGSSPGLKWARLAVANGHFRAGLSHLSRHDPIDMSKPVTPPADEKSLLIVAVAQDRDRECFAALFAYFAPGVRSYLLRLGMHATLADELAQETLLAAAESGKFLSDARDRIDMDFHHCAQSAHRRATTRRTSR